MPNSVVWNFDAHWKWFFFSSLICEELDQPRTGEEDEKLDDINENEKDATERRKIRGEILSRF